MESNEIQPSSAEPPSQVSHVEPPPLANLQPNPPETRDLSSRPDEQLPDTFTEFVWEVLLGAGHAHATANAHAATTATTPTTVQPSVSAVYPEADGAEASSPTAAGGGVLSSIGSWTSSLVNLVARPSLSVDSTEAPTANTNIPDAMPPPTAALQAPLHLDTLQLLDREVDDPVLTIDMAKDLRHHLPRRIQEYSRWSLLYSLEQHGISLQTLYANVQTYCDKACDGIPSRCPSLLVVRDAEGGVFGAYVSDLWRSNSGSGAVAETNALIVSMQNLADKQQQAQSSSSAQMMAGSASRGRSFYGSGECFLFQRNPETGAVCVFPWTQENDYFMLSEADFLALGGGDGKFSLFLDQELYRGHSSAAPTFANPGPLCLREDGEFQCVALEVWGFLDT